MKESGLSSLLGKRVLLMCANYFYTGVLTSFSSTCVELENPSIVYETGQWSNSKFSDEQKLYVKTFFVMINAIEAFGESK